MKKKDFLYQAIAMVKWNGSEYACTDIEYNELPHFEQVAIKVKAKLILTVIKTMNRLISEHKERERWIDGIPKRS